MDWFLYDNDHRHERVTYLILKLHMKNRKKCIFAGNLVSRWFKISTTLNKNNDLTNVHTQGFGQQF